MTEEVKVSLEVPNAESKEVKVPLEQNDTDANKTSSNTLTNTHGASKIHNFTHLQTKILDLKMMKPELTQIEIAAEIGCSRDTVTRFLNRTDIKKILEDQREGVLKMIQSWQPYLATTLKDLYSKNLTDDPRLATQIGQFFLKNVLESKVNINAKLDHTIEKKVEEMTEQEMLEYWKEMNKE